MVKTKPSGRGSRDRVFESSGNVFADFEISDAEEIQTKVKIAYALNKILESIGDLTQQEVATRLCTEQPKVSALKRYQLNGLSVEKLMDFITALEYDINIKITPAARRKESGRIHVSIRAS